MPGWRETILASLVTMAFTMVATQRFAALDASAAPQLAEEAQMIQQQNYNLAPWPRSMAAAATVFNVPDKLFQVLNYTAVPDMDYEGCLRNCMQRNVRVKNAITDEEGVKPCSKRKWHVRSPSARLCAREHFMWRGQVNAPFSERTQTKTHGRSGAACGTNRTQSQSFANTCVATNTQRIAPRETFSF